MAKIARRRILTRRIPTIETCQWEESLASPGCPCLASGEDLGFFLCPRKSQSPLLAKTREMGTRLGDGGKLIADSFLRRFDQLHFAVSRAVQDHHFAFGIAEHEDVAIAEVGLFDGFFEGHGA